MRNFRKKAVFTVLLGSFAVLGCEGGEREGIGIPISPEEAAAPLSPLPEGAQAMSFLGEPLFPPESSDEVRIQRENQLQEALQALEADPQGADAIIWAGRRYAYMGEYRRAIELFSQGLGFHPQDPRFYRHRGHRYISVREVDRAIADFRAADELIEGTEDEVEPDGQPNAAGVPTSTLHFNILYHYGLAYFIKGEFEEAARIYERCMEASIHPDSKIATAHWWYMALRRAGLVDEAAAMIETLDLDGWAPQVIESGSYLELLRLYAEAGTPSAESVERLDSGTLEGATLGYGIGNYLLYNGFEAEAREVFEKILEARGQWASFGYIAAEADLARLRG